MDVRDRRTASPASRPAAAIRLGLLTSLALLGCAAFLCGCAGKAQPAATRPASMYDRQQALLHDPFGWSPDLKKSDMTVSGDGDDGAALKRDLEHVANP